MSKREFLGFLYKFASEAVEPSNLRKVADQKGWRTDVAGPLITPVERDILTFDTFAVMAELSGDMLQFGGGTLLNWVYATSSPRFSFDVDSQITRAGIPKKEILNTFISEINDRLRKMKKVVSLDFGGKNIEIGSIMYDKEKDHFPDVLSLKRPVFSSTTGAEAHTYLRKEVDITMDYSRASLKLKEEFGGKMPRIDNVRVEIGIPKVDKNRFPYSKFKVRPLVAPEVQVEPVEASVTVKEFIMGLKIYKLGKKFTEAEEELTLVDFVKSICDIWACSTNYEAEFLTKYLKNVCQEKGAAAEKVRDESIKRVAKLQLSTNAKDWFERSGQTSFIARSHNFAEVCRVTKQVIEKVEIEST